MRHWPIIVLLLCNACNSPEKLSIERDIETARADSAPAEREWHHYLGDNTSSQYSPLTRINRDNVTQLKLAWQYDASGGNENLQGESQHNPLIVKGVLYGSAANARRLFALNASTGEELWSWDAPGYPGQVARGLLYWSDEAGEEERLFFSSGSSIYAIDPRSGKIIETFGDGGQIALGEQLGEETFSSTFLAATTPGVIYQDLLIQGTRVNEFSGAAPGHIRAYDVRSGELRWRFHTIPRPGEFGADTWAPAALASAGGANSWAGMALDEERGLVYIPTGSASFDFYGADREGDNLFANSLLALDAKTGERRWHYQMVRHDLWDRDLPSPPNLVTVERKGQSIDAVAQATKTGHLFVFDRENGRPLFPIREVPVYGEALPGEHPPSSQPLPTRPPPFTAQGVTREDLTTRSPQAHADVKQRLSGHLHEGMYNLPSLQGSILRPGFDGGAEWGGSAWDQRRGLLFVNANEIASVLEMAPRPGTTMYEAMNPEMVYRMACGQCHGRDRRGSSMVPSLHGIGGRLSPWELHDTITSGRGRMPPIDPRLGTLGPLVIMWYLYTAGDALEEEPANESSSYANTGYPDFIAGDGLPATKPPWGTLSAIDLSSGDIRWRIPLGDYPTALEQGLSGLGASNYGGPVATASGLLFIAATPDRKFRAFNSDTGEQLWETELPAGGFATPAIYEAGGKQYVVIDASGTKLGNPPGRYYLAFSLP